VVLWQSEQHPEEGKEKWYIVRQNDLYQTDQWIAFLLFLFPGAGYALLPLSLFCGLADQAGGCFLGQLLG
jgi:hypothetical protein